MNTLHFERECVVPFPADQVWPLLSDTDRINRSLGLSPVQYAPTEDAEGRPCLLARAKFNGIPLRWLEYPFQWKEGEGYSVKRVYQGGPVASCDGGCTLREKDGRSIVRILLDVVPRNPLGVLVARWMIVPQAVDGMIKFCGRIGAFLEGRATDAFVRSSEAVDVNIPRLEYKLKSIEARGFSPDLLERLRDHLVRGHDEDVMRMRPFALADRWGLERRDVLRLFLHATAEGILSLSWNVLCPNCRVTKADFGTLRNLQGEAHCEVCRIDFSVDFDRLVELRFSVRPDVRRAELAQYCVGGPQNTPHIVAQSVLPPQAQIDWRLPAGEDTLRVRVRETQTLARLFRDGTSVVHESTFTVSAEGTSPRASTMAVGEGRVVIHNQTSDLITATLEREPWPSDACSAAMVSTMAEFRRLFSAEVLAADLQVGIQNVAVLFSDLKGSTQFYLDVGDAPAFSVVRDHFDMLGSIVEKHGGTFVKTMGDAIMAVFLNGRDGVAAALDMQRIVQSWDDDRIPDPHTFVKIGLHQGPVIAVTFNDRLDYFGNTVNMAARVQAQSAGGDIVISRAVYDDPEVGRILTSGVAVEEFDACLPGFTAPVPLRRLRIAGTQRSDIKFPAQSLAPPAQYSRDAV